MTVLFQVIEIPKIKRLHWRNVNILFYGFVVCKCATSKQLSNVETNATVKRTAVYHGYKVQNAFAILPICRTSVQ